MKGLKTYLEQKEDTAGRDPVICTRTSLSRNISGFRFDIRNRAADRKKILSLVKDAAGTLDELKGYDFYNLQYLEVLKRELLAEENIITEPMVKKAGGRGVMFDLEKSRRLITSVMINEEDHLKIQGVTGGLDIRKTFTRIAGIEKKLEGCLNFAFDKDFGYLTSSPTLLGSGLEVSILAHLPGLVMSLNINDLIKTLNRLNCTVQGYHIHDSEILGNMFLISKESSLERNDSDTVEEMEAICLNIIEQEKKQTEKLKKEKPINVVDNVFRSYGVVKHARLLSFEEGIELLSMLKLGLGMGILDNLRVFDFYRLINIIVTSYLRSYLIDKNATIDEVDQIRADIIRKEIFMRE